MPNAATPNQQNMPNYPPALAVADFLPQDNQVRAVIASALSAYTYTNPTNQPTVGLITANANGALAAPDGVTLAVGDRVLLVAGAAGADNGIYVVNQLGSTTTPFILQRAADMLHGAIGVSGMIVTVDTIGTAWGGSTWKLFANGPITIATTALAFWPRLQSGTQALSAGAATVSNLWVRSATLSVPGGMDTTAAAAVKCVLTAGAGTGTLALTGTTTDVIAWSVQNW
jgi:hypothetical protein